MTLWGNFTLVLLFTAFLRVQGNDLEECRLKSILQPYLKYCEPINIDDRVKCGQDGWLRSECNREGCCFDGRLNNSNQKFERCFYPSLKNAKQAALSYAKAKKEYTRSVAQTRTSTPTPNSRGDEIRSFYYDRVASLYSLIDRTGHYNAPAHAAMELAEYYPAEERSKLRVLDVGAGTGLVGNKLRQLGFSHIDALEPSPGMLFYLKKENRNVYENLFETSIGYESNTNIQRGSYDSLVCVGALVSRHIPVESLGEMIDLVKPGGTLFITTNAENINDSIKEEYYARLETHMSELVANGRWKKMAEVVLDECFFNGSKCRLFIFKRTKPSPKN